MKLHIPFLLLLYIVWGSFFVSLFPRLLVLLSDGLYAGHNNIWADWALHIGMVNWFAHRDPAEWFSTHPLFSEENFSYYFGVNLISGLLIKLGLTVTQSLVYPSIVYSLLLIGALYFLFYRLSGNRWIPLLTISLFFLSSGPGYLKVFNDASESSLAFRVMNPQIEYSKENTYSWRAGNYVRGMLVPQRPFLLGMLVSTVLTRVLLSLLIQKRKVSAIYLLVSGLIAGSLCVIHVQSLVVLSLVCLFLLLFDPSSWKKLLVFGVTATIVTLTLYLFFMHNSNRSQDFIGWKVGWTAGGGLVQWVVMWSRLWGLILPFSVLGLVVFRNRFSQYGLAFISALAVVFFASNLIRFQPYVYDNTKFFMWVYLGICFITATVFVATWDFGLFAKIVVVLLFCHFSFTGCLELIRINRTDLHTIKMLSTEDMLLAERVRSTTFPDAVIATVPTHTNPIPMWSARPVVLGYSGWLWSHGYVIGEREKDLKKLYTEPLTSGEVICKYGIDYIYVGEEESRKYGVEIPAFEGLYPAEFITDRAILYKVPLDFCSR